MTETVKIGKTDISTIKLGLGTNKVGGHNLFPGLLDTDGAAVVKAALDQGITLLDTAFMYGLGRSEEIIGEVLQKYPRHEVLIATKAAQDPNHDLKANNDPQFLTQAIDAALKRLKTDYIDIFYIHFPDDHTPKDEAVDALARAKKAGKIRAVGVSNFSFDQVQEANRDGALDIVEDNYSLVHRQAEQALMPYLKANQISFVPYFPLASGLLTGKYTAGDGDKFNQFTPAQYQEILTALGQVKTLADGQAATVAQVILAWYMANPDISVVIPGARKPEQVKSNVGALDVRLSDADYQQIDQLFKDFK
ncbi:NADP-dependent oxidoreductase domain-containing protein [Agrilactobacillus composti DSM 18527 = JCM 14202]|uniref:NADP-dependent oxidoreductase domain-containing protein n=1 Tax=Agrilactobacillus composti DSM 18527 = JCM 14202 TaxID=1423734 RepID=X0PCD9_9LACO|nr:aldo/keto reductase [Agrilactobacillus composti]KRM30666.1 NADP-dependent oxidoreductase domain-containing protein [Agrilactobacillus composti DSM 18527 = JCM 14202]GAF38239.1 oxidoreductase ion channel [Agrilactobacillus composti DSM 18527 = JCM 14202]